MFGCFFLYPISLRVRYKYGIRSTVLFGGALLLPLFLFSPMVPNMDLLFLTFSIPTAIACSIIGCATFTTIIECFERHQGLAFGIRSSMNALGTVMFSFVLPILLSELGWQRTFWILTGISFITMCYACVYVDSGHSDPYPSERVCSVSTVISLPAKDFSKDDLSIYWKLLKSREVLIFLAAHIIFGFVVFMPPVFMVSGKDVLSFVYLPSFFFLFYSFPPFLLSSFPPFLFPFLPSLLFSSPFLLPSFSLPLSSFPPSFPPSSFDPFLLSFPEFSFMHLDADGLSSFLMKISLCHHRSSLPQTLATRYPNPNG